MRKISKEWLVAARVGVFAAGSACAPGAKEMSPASDAACASDGDETPSSDGSQELRLEVERRLDEAAAAGFSGAVRVTVFGETLLARGEGLADRELGVANTSETAFDFGSVMKDLTAAAIFKLVGEGMLTLDTPLSSVFDEVPSDKVDITILQIVQHRAGFEQYHDTEGDFEPMTRLEARERIFGQTLRFEPGRGEGYSNAGYTLLADVIETVTGQAFPDYVRNELLGPARMQQSGFFGDPVWATVATAKGYDADVFGANDPATWPLTWALMGNGGFVTTIDDMERWLIATWDGEVLDSFAFETYVAEYLSLGAGPLSGQTVYGYAGAGDYGLGGSAIDAPDVDTRVIVATNAYEVFDGESLAVELATLVLEEGSD